MSKGPARGYKNYFLAAGFAACVALAMLAWGLRLQVGRLEIKNRQEIAELRSSVPDFDSQTVARLKKNTAVLQSRITSLCAIFDPRYKWMKEDYDYSIYFIEELGSTTQFLKQKSLAKHVNLPVLGFKEQLPSEQEAVYLLSQLYAIKATVGLGMDYGVNFKSIAPLGVSDTKMPGVRLVKSRFQMSCPPEALMDFIIQLNEVVPKVCFSSLSVASGEGAFDIDVTVEQVIIDTGLRPAQGEQPSAAALQAFTAGHNSDFIHTLRSNNPFLVPTPLAAGANAVAVPEKPKPRFIYRGKARKQSRQVVVIEDTLKDQTLFVGLEDRIDKFKLVDFSDDAVVLKNIEDSHELIIKREEK